MTLHMPTETWICEQQRDLIYLLEFRTCFIPAVKKKKYLWDYRQLACLF